MIYDISQELFSSKLFPGDPGAVKKAEQRIENGDACNLTSMSLCVHNGTHLDAPYHFYKDGTTIEKMNLERCFGKCHVIELSGEIDGKTMKAAIPNGAERLLIKGEITLTVEAAKAITEADLLLIGVEGITVGPMESPKAVHLVLLGNETAIIEGLVLSDVPCGEYLLSALPLKLGSCDGAPCRVALMTL